MARNTLLELMDRDGDKPVAMSARCNWYSDKYLLTRDLARIRDVCSKVILPGEQWSRADFPEDIEHLTVWTEDSVIVVYENHESGNSILQVPRDPPTDADREWDA